MLALLVFIGAFAWLLWYLHERNQWIKRISLPGPEPEYIFGSSRHLQPNSQRPMIFEQMVQKYGDTFGIIDGNIGVVVTKDVEILQDVFVKKFPYFHGRMLFPLQGDVDNENNMVGVFVARGSRWKRLRAITNSCFTTGSLKNLMPTIEECIQSLKKRIRENGDHGKSFESNPDISGSNKFSAFSSLFADFTVDVIARVAFGEKRDLQLEGDTQYGPLARAIFSSQMALRDIAMLFPELRLFWRWVFIMCAVIGNSVPTFKIHENMSRIIAARKKNPDRGGRPDLLQMMINAELTEDNLSQITGDSDGGALKLGAVNINKKMTTNEILQQCVEILFAGSETTSNTLTFATHHLAIQPDVQQKLYEEICTRMHSEESIDYDTLLSLQYVDAFIKEILRLYPHTSAVHNRKCFEDCTVGQKSPLRIPKGYLVQANTWAVHHDKTLWGDDALECRPERWLEPNPLKHPMAFMPFGFGPRICLGMRLAMIEMKLVMVHLVRTFEFKRAPETVVPIEYKDGVGTVQMASSWVKIEERHKSSEHP